MTPLNFMFYFQRKKELKGGLGADEMQRGSKKRSLIDEERAIHEAYQVFVPKEFFHLVLVQQFFKLQRAHISNQIPFLTKLYFKFFSTIFEILALVTQVSLIF